LVWRCILAVNGTLSATIKAGKANRTINANYGPLPIVCAVIKYGIGEAVQDAPFHGNALLGGRPGLRLAGCSSASSPSMY
jgi:hypothetical protein